MANDIAVLEPQTEEKEYSLSGGSFFNQNPDKILAEAYEASGLHGKVTKYRKKKGVLTPQDALREIETPAFIGHGVTNVSAGESVIAAPDLLEPTAKANPILDISLGKAEDGIIKTQRAAKRKIVEFDEPSIAPTIPFIDVFRTYNLEKDISTDEVNAFLWYQHQIDNTYKGEWLNIFNPTTLSQAQEAAYKIDWINKGVLFYFNGELLPAYLYLSENIYERKQQFEQDASLIKQIYGQAAYEAHKKKLEETFDIIYQKRLKLDDPDPDKRLHLKPYGDFTDGIEIQNWNLQGDTGEPANFGVVISGAAKTAGQINWKSANSSVGWRNPGRPLLSINDAFRFYLKNDPNRPSLPHNFQWEDIFRYYLDKMPAKTGSDPTVVARTRALAKEVGDKMFSNFLADVILENDRVKIERLWNEKFNSSLPLNTKKIPVAFKAALYYPDNQLLVVEPEKREAVAFSSVRGSSLNAYQVGVGKANLLTSNILTPKGWVKMKDIKVGSDVIARNGKPTKVLKVFPQGEMPAYRVTMSDGSFTEVTGDHLWTVQNIWDRYTGEWRLMSTLEMAKKLYNQRNDRIYSIPMVEPVQFEHKDVPIDPYLLGALLGDGGLTEYVTFSNPEIEIQDRIRKIVESYGLFFTSKTGGEGLDFRISGGDSSKKKNVILDSLRELGLIGKKSIDKFIPDIYLYNSIDVRLALLHGIMDTDGYVNKNGHCTQICTSSKRLSEGIIELIRSFGGTVNENVKHPKYTYKGELKEGHEAYILSIRLPAEIIPFTTKKHLDRFKPKTKYKPIRFINSIEPIGKHQAQCIKIEDADHLYVCDEYIVTHNTFAAVFTMAQFLDAGQCKRPFLVVPNQVYKQFYAELHGLLPHIKINDLFNLSKDYYKSLLDENGVIQMVEEGSISMLTYEGFERIGFKEQTQAELLTRLDEALVQIQSVAAFSDSKKAEGEAIRTAEKLKGMLGKALKATTTNIEDLGFDFVCFDEAHTLKNIFSSVKAKGKEDPKDTAEKASKKMYDITGSASTVGIKAFCLCSYIQLHNKGRNVLLLTATPFSNSPLEIFSMLSLIAYDHLRELGISNINDFFDNYCQMSYELIINSKLQPVRKQIFKAFDNLLSMRKLIYTFMLHKEAGVPDQNGNTIALVRPDKWVLPYKGHLNGKNVFVPAEDNQFIDTVLPLSSDQKDMMDEIIAYVEGKISYDRLGIRGFSLIEEDEDEDIDTEDLKKEKSVVDLIIEGGMSDKEKAGVRTLRGVNFARSLALSPYLYEFSGLGSPDYKKYVESSPKLRYVMGCIATVKKWHEDKGEVVSGQVIYMDRGKKYFGLLKEYLVNVIGYKSHEIGIIRSGAEGTPAHKDAVKNGFNGFVFNEATKQFNDISEADRIKIVIGTSSIREGLNLNRYASCLYNCSIDWRPTDEIQLEGRIWRQGNTFENIRIILPLMSDSMDIFMLQKLEDKTGLINSIWSWNDQSNVFHVEELDPKEQKLALITNPKVIAQLELDDIIIKADEEISVINNNVTTAENIIGFFDKRTELEKELMKVLSILDPDEPFKDITAMMNRFEKLLKEQDEERETKQHFIQLLREKVQGSRYDYKLLDYDYSLNKPWSYGNMKGSVAMLKKAQRSFFERFNVADDKDAVQQFINEQKEEAKRKEEEKSLVSSDAHIEEMIEEIELKRKQKKMRIRSVEDRITEFASLNHLLGLKAAVSHSEDFKQVAIEGCPPQLSDGKPDVSPEGIKNIESCLEMLPQTKDLNVDEFGEYTAGRLKLHKVIKGKLRSGMACVVPNDKPIAILMGGTPGSGKSSFLRKYAPNLAKEKIFKIDADEIRAMLPEYQGWNSKATHKETQDIYMGLLKDISEGKPCRFDILWDGTMNKADNYKPLIGSLKHLGYEIFMIYVKVPWDVSRRRTIERYVKDSTDGKFGRYVPMAVVDEANQRGTKAFEEIRNLADGYMTVDGESNDILDQGGVNLLADRGYFDHVPTEKEGNVKVAKAKAMSMKQRIRILNLKEE